MCVCVCEVHLDGGEGGKAVLVRDQQLLSPPQHRQAHHIIIYMYIYRYIYI